MNETRRIVWSFPNEVDLEPIFHELQDIEQGMHIDVTVTSITTTEEYAIFDAINNRNLSLVLDYIDQRVGLNSVDEWGQTPLMIAIQLNQLDMIAALLNSRMPRVDVNRAKSVSLLSFLTFLCVAYFYAFLSVRIHCLILCRAKSSKFDYYWPVKTWSKS